MTQEIKKSGKLFRKYFIYYILILFIPVFITFIGISYFLYEQNEEQASSYAESVISLIGNSFDETFNTIYAVNEIIINDDELKHVFKHSSNETEKYYEFYIYQNNLQNIKTVVPFLENIVLVPTNEKADYLLSSNGTYTADIFYNNIYLFEEKFHDLILNTSNIIKGKANNQDALAYALKGAHSGVQNIYIIPNKTFDDMLFENELMHSEVTITDLNNNVLYSYGMQEQPQNILLDNISENNRLEIDGVEYIVSAQQSKATSLTYFIMTPVSMISSNVSSLMIIFAVCVLLVVLIGFVFAYLLAKKMTLPIYNIQSMLKTEHIPTEKNNDELGEISLAISSMSSDITKMKNILDETSDDIIYINLMKLLTGEISSKHEINANLQSTGIALKNKYYTVAVFDFGAAQSSKNNMPRFTHIQELYDDATRHLCYLNSYDTSYVYLLIMCEKPIVDIYNYLAVLKQNLFQTFACDIAVAFCGGDFYFSEISTAFYNSLLTLDQKFIMGKNSILNNEELKTVKNDDCESFNYQEFYKLLLGGTKKEIIEYISSYNMAISYVNNNSVHKIKAKILGVFNFLHDTFPVLVSKYQQQISPLLENYDTAEEFLNYICEVSIYVFENLKQSNKDNKFLNINKFLNQNYYKDNFSIQLVADEFQMSVSTLSKYYKEITGINISEEVNRLKIDSAKELLINTDLTVNEIVLKIGYYNTSSFIRKFKECTSVTPGKYREKYKNQSNK